MEWSAAQRNGARVYVNRRFRSQTAVRDVCVSKNFQCRSCYESFCKVQWLASQKRLWCGPMESCMLCTYVVLLFHGTCCKLSEVVSSSWSKTECAGDVVWLVFFCHRHNVYKLLPTPDWYMLVTITWYDLTTHYRVVWQVCVGQFFGVHVYMFTVPADSSVTFSALGVIKNPTHPSLLFALLKQGLCLSPMPCSVLVTVTVYTVVTTAWLCVEVYVVSHSV